MVARECHLTPLRACPHSPQNPARQQPSGPDAELEARRRDLDTEVTTPRLVTSLTSSRTAWNAASSRCSTCSQTPTRRTAPTIHTSPRRATEVTRCPPPAAGRDMPAIYSGFCYKLLRNRPYNLSLVVSSHPRTWLGFSAASQTATRARSRSRGFNAPSSPQRSRRRASLGAGGGCRFPSSRSQACRASSPSSGRTRPSGSGRFGSTPPTAGRASALEASNSSLISTSRSAPTRRVPSKRCCRPRDLRPSASRSRLCRRAPGSYAQPLSSRTACPPWYSHTHDRHASCLAAASAAPSQP